MNALDILFRGSKDRYLIGPALLLLLSLLFNACQIKTTETGQITTPTLATSTAVGTLEGGFKVGQFGTPNYNIPLELPPGTNGVAPHLSLIYQNPTRNGLMGVGFEIHGLSMVTRTGKIIPQDSVKGGVSMSNNDRFALNGQRLIAYKDSSGNVLNTVAERDAAYGKNGTEYRTEVESWLRVFSQGTCGDGPCSFSIEGKNGSVSEFGYTTDSRIISADSETVMIWAVNQVTDRNGNYVSMVYDSSQQTGNCLPLQVNYTGNANTGLAPQRMVAFGYESREDSIEAYVGGSQYGCAVRLSNITTYVDLDGDGKEVNTSENQVLEYQISYSYGATTGRSVVDSIRKCDAAGTCLPATEFTWTHHDDSAVFVDTLTPIPEDYYGLYTDDDRKLKADFNGDGKIDLALLKDGSSSIPILLATSEGSFYTVTASTPSGFSSLLNDASVDVQTGDWNGDGRTDLFFFAYDAANVGIITSDADFNLSGTLVDLPSTVASSLNGSAATRLLADFNGDGLTDIAAFQAGLGEVPLVLTQSDGSFQAFTPTLPSTVSAYVNATNATHSTGDFNGDGLADVATFSDGLTSLPLLLSDGSGGFEGLLSDYPANIASYVNDNSAKRSLGDFNGDGLIDIAVFYSGLTSVPIAFSTGDGSLEGILQEIPDDQGLNFTDATVTQVTGDFNGDGLWDVMAFKDGLDYIPGLISTRQSQFTYQEISLSTDFATQIIGSGVTQFIADFNGDGMMDVAAVQDGYTQMPVLFSQGVDALNNKPDMLTQVVDGIGAITRIDYLPMTDSTVYTGGATADYPYASIQFPEYVVAHYELANSASDPTTLREFDLSYAGALVDHYRGFLGFQSKMVQDTLVEAVIEYVHALSFTFNGVVTEKNVWDSNDLTEALGREYHSFDTTEVDSTGIYHLWKTAVQKDHFTYGNYNFTQLKLFAYDSDQRNITRIGDRPDTSTTAWDVYTYFDYPSYDEEEEDWWTSFFPTAEKALKDSSAGVNWSDWESTTDYYWHQFVYDARMNRTQNLVYADTLAADLSATWTGHTSSYDDYGNVLTQTSPPNFSSDSISATTTFDSTYHTFIAQTTSPNPQPGTAQGAPLVTYLKHEPRFGRTTYTADPNGNVMRNIPDEGMDGLGRILLVEQSKTDSDELVTDSVFTYENIGSEGFAVLGRIPVDWDNTSSPDTNWLFTRAIYDGFSRQVAGYVNGANAAEYQVSQTTFNDLGLVDKQYVSYYQDSTATTPQGNGDYYVQKLYDNYGRLTAVYQPSPDSSGAFVFTQGIEFDSTDNRKIWTLVLSPENGSDTVYWLKQYDALGRAASISGPWNSQTEQGDNWSEVSYSYDGMGRITEEVDQLGLSTRYQYNSLGGIHWLYNPVTDSVVHSYNLNNWNTVRKSASGSVIYAHDDLGRILTKEQVDSNGDTSLIATYTYDSDSLSGNGQAHLCQVVTPEFTETYVFDQRGNQTSVTTELKDLGQSFTMGMDFDPVGRLTTLTYPDGESAVFDYNHSGHFNDILLNGDTLVKYSDYSANGQVGTIAYGNGVYSNLSFDLLGRQASGKTWKGSYVYLEQGYTWNNANKITAISDLRDNQESDLSQVLTYTQAGRIASAQGAYGSETYGYDAAGNRTSLNEGIYAYSPTTYHQVDSIQAEGITTRAFTYRADGCMTGKISKDASGADSSALVFDFDVEGRLHSVVDTAHGSQDTLGLYTYADGSSRIARQDSDGTVSYYVNPFYEVVVTSSDDQINTKYVHGLGGTLYSKSASAAEVDLLNADEVRQRTAAPLIMVHSSPLDRMGDWNEGVRVAGLLAMLLLLVWGLYRGGRLLQRQHKQRGSLLWQGLGKTMMGLAAIMLMGLETQANMTPGANGAGIPEANTQRFYHFNHLGSSVILTDENGSEQANVAYKPFGNLDDGNSSGTNDFRPKFSGKEENAFTGLQYFTSRYYDGELGRFLSPDPARQYFSPYLYGNNDPMTGVDPDGQFFVIIAMVVLAIVGAYVGASVANGSFNPANWNIISAKTWVGLVAGAAAGAAVVANVGTGLAAWGAVSAESVAIGTTTSSTFASTSESAAFITSDAFSLTQNPSLANGISLGVDFIPVVGTMLGASAKAIEEIGSETSTELTSMDSEERSAQDVRENSCTNSFTEGTLVETPDGPRKIEDLEVGDLVYSWDFDAGEVRPYAIMQLLRYHAEGLVEIRTPQETIYVTTDHPFYTSDYNWVHAGALTVDDELVVMPVGSLHEAGKQGLEAASEGFHLGPAQGQYAWMDPIGNGPLETIHIQDIRHIPDTVVSVFNLEVEKAHNYFAGNSLILVHNGKCNRRRYVGGTPNKRSWQADQIFMRRLALPHPTAGYDAAGRRFVLVDVDRSGTTRWELLDGNRNIHMGHRIDAVLAWNYGHPKYADGIPLKEFGAKSKIVRDFMKDPSNYDFEYGPLNSGNGARLREVYMPPRKNALPSMPPPLENIPRPMNNTINIRKPNPYEVNPYKR